MKAVLQTRCVGMAPDSSGHALAPPEYVYECREPERVPFIKRLARLSIGKWMVIASMAYLAWLACAAAAQLASLL